MSVFIIANHHHHYLGKQAQWLDAGEITHIFRTAHYDVALNQLIESNARDIEQRLTLLECPLDDKGQPVLADAIPARKKPVSFDDPEQTATDDSDAHQEDRHPEDSQKDDDAVTNDHGQAPAIDYAG